MLIGSSRTPTKEQLLWDEKVVDVHEIGRSVKSLKARNPLFKVGFYVSDFDDLTPADCVYLQLCRTNCDLLILGIPTDYSIRLNKKNSIFSTAERCFRMGSMSYVNYITVFDEETCGFLTSVIDPDMIFYGRTQNDKEKYDSILIKDRLKFIEYPWFEERREGSFFNL